MLEALLLLLGGALLIVAAFLYGAFSWGWVLWKFWYWFLIPVFPMIPNVTLIQCVGLMCIIDLFKNQGFPMVKKEYRDEITTNIITVIAPIAVLFVGWVIHVCIVH